MILLLFKGLDVYFTCFFTESLLCLCLLFDLPLSALYVSIVVIFLTFPWGSFKVVVDFSPITMDSPDSSLIFT